MRLNVARYHAHVVLQPPVALVQIDQSFYNPYNRQEEGTFVFNLPRGASVSRFAMYVDAGQLIEGELVERQRAAGVYQSIVTRRRDPAILEQIGDNLFKMRVFPIFPKDTQAHSAGLHGSAGSGRRRVRLPPAAVFRPAADLGFPHQRRDRAAVAAGKKRREPFSSGHGVPPPRRRRDRLRAQRAGLPAAVRLPAEIHAGGRTAGRPAELHGRAAAARAEADTAKPRSGPLVGPPGDVLPGVDSPRRPRLPAGQGKARAKTAEPPADVLVLADTSSSMRNCQLLRQSVRMVLHSLRRPIASG